jgi:hypothetical protein
LTVRGRSAIVCDYRTRVISDSAMDGSLPAPHFDNGFLHLAVVVEAVRMWEAFFAFHICIACFLFRIRGNTWVSSRIPDRRKLLMLLGWFQVSVRIPSTTLGGMECQHSSGAQHRAYCSTNDCVAGDRQERLNEVPAMQSGGTSASVIVASPDAPQTTSAPVPVRGIDRLASGVTRLHLDPSLTVPRGSRQWR